MNVVTLESMVVELETSGHKGDTRFRQKLRGKKIKITSITVYKHKHTSYMSHA